MGLNQLHFNYNRLSFLVEVGVKKTSCFAWMGTFDWPTVKNYLLKKWKQANIERDLETE